jgi:hypothetical protein
MLEWIKSLFQPRVIYRVIEYNGQRTHFQGGDKGIRESVATLSSHPGFLYLLSKCNAQNALLSSKLKNSFHQTLREVDLLQAGIYWSDWLKQELDKSTMGATRPQTDAFDEERQAFEALDAQIERVGQE